jgi:hypothetical protein
MPPLCPVYDLILETLMLALTLQSRLYFRQRFQSCLISGIETVFNVHYLSSLLRLWLAVQVMPSSELA